MIQQRVIAEYRGEMELAKQPGYMSRYDDDYEDELSSADLPLGSPQPTDPSRPNRHWTKPQIEPPTAEPRPPHKAPERVQSPVTAPVSRTSSVGGASAALGRGSWRSRLVHRRGVAVTTERDGDRAG